MSVWRVNEHDIVGPTFCVVVSNLVRWGLVFNADVWTGLGADHYLDESDGVLQLVCS